MLEQSRREFMGKALAMGAGATLVRPFDPAPARAAAPSAAADVPDPNFAIGKVVSADGSALSIVDLDGAKRTLLLGPTSRHWRSAKWNIDAPQTGDCIMGRGARQADGSLLIDRIWSNIRNYRGRVQASSSRALTMVTDAGEKVSFAAAAETVAVASSGTESTGTLAPLKSGDDALIVAFADPTTGALTASRAMASLPEPPSWNGEDAAPGQVVSPDFTVEHTGNSTWFCCGNVSGCGHCGSSGAGYCSGCRSDSYHIAWPKHTEGCVAGCSGCCILSSFPAHSCNVSMPIEDPCQGTVITVYIKDCGPVQRCRTTGCEGYQGVHFDLTPCAFSAIGASFDIGFCNLWTGPAS